MKKLLIFLIAVIFVLLSGMVAYLICNSAGICTDFYEFKFIDAVCFFADVILSGVLVIVLGIISSKENKTERKSSIIVSIFEKLQNSFESFPKIQTNKDGVRFWTYVLSVKKILNRDIAAVMNNTHDRRAKALLEELKTKADIYFEFVANNLYEKQNFTDALIEDEMQQREIIINLLLNCQINFVGFTNI